MLIGGQYDGMNGYDPKTIEHFRELTILPADCLTAILRAHNSVAQLGIISQIPAKYMSLIKMCGLFLSHTTLISL